MSWGKFFSRYFCHSFTGTPYSPPGLGLLRLLYQGIFCHSILVVSIMNIEVMFNVAHLLVELTFTASRVAHSCYSLGMPHDHVSLTLIFGTLKMRRFTVCTFRVILLREMN
jgi:hypothetical protein